MIRTWILLLGTMAAASAAFAQAPAAPAKQAAPKAAAPKAPASKPEEFRDCDICPPMVVVLPGSFDMGSPASEKGRSSNEGPVHKVDIAYRYAVGKHEVTFAEWDACVADGGCRQYKARDHGLGRGNKPVIDVTWIHAKAYTIWLSGKTGKEYRLLSEAEWEYAARAGTKTPYWWGPAANHEYSNYGKDKCCGSEVRGRDQWEMTAPVGSFPPNAFGIHDMLGNVWEWVEDCWQETYDVTPRDGAPTKDGNCNVRVMRGGAWSSMPVKLRVAHHDAYPPDDRGEFIGFRIARSMN